MLDSWGCSEMSVELLVVLTVVEIVLLVAVLAIYLVLITRRLHAVSNVLGQVSTGLSSVQGSVGLVGAGTALLNRKLEAIERALPPIAIKAESLS